MSIQATDIKKLQNNLNTIRKIAGWTAQELGDKIGVTKQTISNIENQKNAMTLTQYIAIRTVLDYEIENNKENEVLAQVVHILLDVPDDDISEEDREKIDRAAVTLAAASVGGIGAANLGLVSAGLLGGITGVVLASSTMGATSWMKKLMKK